jgi:hypothetical protein
MFITLKRITSACAPKSECYIMHQRFCQKKSVSRILLYLNFTYFSLLYYSVHNIDSPQIIQHKCTVCSQDGHSVLLQNLSTNRRADHKYDHSPPSSTEVNSESFVPFPLCLHAVDTTTLYFLIKIYIHVTVQRNRFFLNNQTNALIMPN